MEMVKNSRAGIFSVLFYCLQYPNITPHGACGQTTDMLSFYLH